MSRLLKNGRALFLVTALISAPVCAQFPTSIITSPPFVPPSVYPDGVPDTPRYQRQSPLAESNLASRLMRPARAIVSPQIESNFAKLTYRSSAAGTKSNLARFVQKTRPVDPTGAAKMEELFSSTNVMSMIDQRMQQTYGMRANNVADAYAVWWVSAWMGSQGRSDDATPGQMAMVKRQTANALAGSTQFISLSDAGKQEMAEALLVQAALIGETIDAYKFDPAMLAKTRAAVAKGAQGMGLDLSTMRLTDEGFVPASGRKTGAVDADAAATPGAAAEQLAAATTTPPAPASGNDNPPYALIAAAGGAGLGGVFLLGKYMGRKG